MNSITRILLAGFLLLSVEAFARGHNHKIERVNEQLAKSELAQNAASTLELFESEYHDRYQKSLSDEFVGFIAELGEDEAEVAMIHVVGENKVQEDGYHCHVDLEEDGSKDFHCEHESNSDQYAYTPQAKNYSLGEFIESLSEMIVELEKNKIDPASLVGIKAWQDRRGLWMTLKPKGAGDVFVRCHYHGKGIDCHQSSSPGSNEPVR